MDTIKCPFGWAVMLTAVAVGRRKRLYSGVRTRTFSGYHLSFFYLKVKFAVKGSIFDLAHWRALHITLYGIVFVFSPRSFA
jgi:hypothetical protein